MCGTIRAKEVKVNLNGTCPDYVFEPNYELMSFDELREYLENKISLNTGIGLFVKPDMNIVFSFDYYARKELLDRRLFTLSLCYYLK